MRSIPLGLLPHHDGSAVYVLNQQPKLLDEVKLRVRIHNSLGAVKAVAVRYSDSGENYETPPARLVANKGGWAWYEAKIVMHNPKMNYKFRVDMADSEVFWLNALGLFDLIQPDINDFRINSFASAPSWGASTVMYQIFPDRFARSEKANNHKTPKWAIAKNWDDDVIASGPGTSEQFFGGDLWGVIDHLSHLKKLGATMIYLTPIFPARSNHRYDASSFDEVDPLLGGNEALAELTSRAHKLGLKVIGDLTLNHSGDSHQWFKAAFRQPKASESDFYYFFEKNTKYDSWWGVPSLPKFNWKSAELRKRFIKGNSSVVAKWLKAPFNLDGWRIDVANMTGRIRDEDAYLDVAQTVRRTMVKVNPDTIMLGEYTGDAAYEVQGDGWQGAMTYSNFTKPLWRWLHNPEATTVPGFMSADGKMMHDGADFVTSYRQFIAGFPWHVRLHNMNPLDTHDIPRFRTFALDGAQKVAAGLQFTFPGIPVIWAGDEFGLDGSNGENSRTPLPWNGERPSDQSMIEVYANLADLRKKNIALVEGSMRFILASEEAVMFVREHKKQTLLVLATRDAVKDVDFDIEAVTGIASAEIIYGSAKIRCTTKLAKVSSPKLSLTVWRLPTNN